MRKLTDHCESQNELAKFYEASTIEQISIVQEQDALSLDTKIRSAFNDNPLNAKELLSRLGVDWTTKKLIAYLKNLDFIEVVKDKKVTLYKLKGTNATTQAKLFA